MQWVQTILYDKTPIQAVIIIAIIIAVGLGLGKIRIKGISLGVTWVFFAGIFAGHIGLSINHDMLLFAQNFGLVLFVYELGLQVGPGFFSSFRKGGVRLNLLGLGVILLGTVMTVGISFGFGLPLSDMVGVLCGATTNTPALAAAQQALQQVGLPASATALSCAVTYPLGVVGVILAMILIRRFMARPSDLEVPAHDDINKTHIDAFRVVNPALFGKSVKEAVSLVGVSFVISRLWRDGKVTIPTSELTLQENDRVLVASTEKDVPVVTMLFGEHENEDWNSEEIDWNAIDSQLESRNITVTRPEINGKKLGSLRLRNSYGINISRVRRAGVQLLANPGLVLQLGDRLTVVGEAKSLDNVAKVLGNRSASLNEPNMAVIFIGMLLGLLLGSIPFFLPGMSAPVKLGLAGGPIVAGLVIGRFGPELHMITYTTTSANLMLRGIGLSLYLSCLGLEAGGSFFETLMQGDGFLWVGLGFLITVIPVLIMGLICMRIGHLDFGSSCGVLCGSMANPMALTYASDNINGDEAAVAYATVYPLGMFVRVVIAQVIILAAL
ncbi:putative transporter [Muribaculaceae bacterium Isolate-037 (Harlan)]|nr:putative transporter [Muribaculaceae bacterium Isolate-037 (Harlan)]